VVQVRQEQLVYTHEHVRVYVHALLLKSETFTFQTQYVLRTEPRSSAGMIRANPKVAKYVNVQDCVEHRVRTAPGVFGGDAGLGLTTGVSYTCIHQSLRRRRLAE
jgi:hypothetical protein